MFGTLMSKIGASGGKSSANACMCENHRRVTSEEPPKRSLASGQNFLGSLSDLDRDISDSQPKKKTATAAPSPTAARAPVEATSAGSSSRPRRLLDLFPPAKESAAMPLLQPPPVAERRPISNLDSP